MKNILKHLIYAVACVLAMTACSPEEYTGADGNIPKASVYKAVVDVDQETNIVPFTITDKDGNKAYGVYPIWTINADKTINTTVNGYKTGTIVLAGEYSYGVKIANRNGISDASIEGTFTINTTRYDFSDAVALLTGNGSKEWRVYSAESGHLACGEGPSDPTNWWKAAAEDKASEGIYDDRITFTTGAQMSAGSYSYSAGEDGLTFCNNGVTTLGVTGASADYSAVCVGQPAAKTDVTYSLGYNADEDAVTITLPAGTLIPYIASDDQINNATTYTVTSLTDKVMTWRIDLSGISWQIIFINGDDEAKEETFDPDNVNWCDVNAAENLGAGFNTKGAVTFWCSEASWAQVADPKFSYADGVYTITTTNATVAQWQGQCTIGEVPCVIEGGQYYDISCKLTVSEKLSGVTIKINKDPDVDGDPNTLYYAQVDLKKGENLVRFAKVTGMNGDTPVAFDQGKFLIDVGGSPAGVEISLSDIIIQKHNPK